MGSGNDDRWLHTVICFDFKMSRANHKSIKQDIELDRIRYKIVPGPAHQMFSLVHGAGKGTAIPHPVPCASELFSFGSGSITMHIPMHKCTHPPAGTGKSTLITHLIQSFMHAKATDPLLVGQVIMAVCVANRAIDSIAEKLVKEKIKFIAEGSDGMGLTCKRHTLKELVKRDPRFLAGLCGHIYVYSGLQTN